MLTPTDLPRLVPLADEVQRIATATDRGQLPAEVLATHLRGRDADTRRILAAAGLDLAQWLATVRFFAPDADKLVPTWAALRTDWPRESISSAFSLDSDTFRRALERPWPDDPVARLAVEGSLPEWLASRWGRAHGFEEATALAKAMNVPAPVSLTVSRRTTPDRLAGTLATDGIRTRPHDGGLVVEGRANLFGAASWRAGLFEVQDAASRRVAATLDVREGETVVDLCAGAGGKTWQLAEAAGRTGRVIAIEPDSQRIHDLSTRLDRHGLGAVEVRAGSALDPQTVSGLEGFADAVLVDAPCSSLGVLRRSPGRKWLLAEADVTRETALQTALLAAGVRLVKPGGRLVYATCSTEPEENEAVADAFTAASRGVWVEVRRWRAFPHRGGDDGFGCFSWVRGTPGA